MQVTASTDGEEAVVQGTDSFTVPFHCEQEFQQLGAEFSNNGQFEQHVVVDGPIVTGQNSASTTSVAKAVVRALLTS